MCSDRLAAVGIVGELFNRYTNGVRANMYFDRIAALGIVGELFNRYTNGVRAGLAARRRAHRWCSG